MSIEGYRGARGLVLREKLTDHFICIVHILRAESKAGIRQI